MRLKKNKISFFLKTALFFFLINLGFGPCHSVEKKEDIVEANFSLDSILKKVDNFHPKIQSSLKSQEIASAKRLEKQGGFDPKINLESDYMRYNDPTNRGDAKYATDNELSVDFLTRSGIKINPGMRYNMGSVKFPLSPTGDTGEYFVGIKLPVLRGFIVNDKSVAEKQAFIGEDLAMNDFYYTRLEVLLGAGSSYWDVLASKTKLEVNKNLLDLAIQRANIIQERSSKGDLPVIDATEAEQEILRRKGNIIQVERELQKNLYKLSTYLWEKDGLPSGEIDPNKLSPLNEDLKEFNQDDLNESIKNAVLKRPEIQALLYEKKITDLDLRLARNLLLPQLDFIANPGIDTGNNSIGPTFKVGANFSFDVNRRVAKGKIQAAELKLKKLDFDLQNIEYEVTTEVKDVVSAIKASYYKYLNSKDELELAKKMEIGEKQKFEYGDSTLFLLNQRERSTLEANIKLIDSIIEYNKNLLLLNAVQASL